MAVTDEHSNEQADVGDIVSIAGYGDLTFEVISTSAVRYKDRTSAYDIIEYETLCREDGRNYHAEDSDVTLVEKRAEVTASNDVEDAVDNSAEIDELLAELSDVSGLINMFGEHEDDARRDRRYALRKAEIVAKIKDITGGW